MQHKKILESYILIFLLLLPSILTPLTVTANQEMDEGIRKLILGRPGPLFNGSPNFMKCQQLYGNEHWKRYKESRGAVNYDTGVWQKNWKELFDQNYGQYLDSQLPGLSGLVNPGGDNSLILGILKKAVWGHARGTSTAALTCIDKPGMPLVKDCKGLLAQSIVSSVLTKFFFAEYQMFTSGVRLLQSMRECRAMRAMTSFDDTAEENGKMGGQNMMMIFFLMSMMGGGGMGGTSSGGMLGGMGGMMMMAPMMMGGGMGGGGGGGFGCQAKGAETQDFNICKTILKLFVGDLVLSQAADVAKKTHQKVESQNGQMRIIEADGKDISIHLKEMKTQTEVQQAHNLAKGALKGATGGALMAYSIKMPDRPKIERRCRETLQANGRSQEWEMMRSIFLGQMKTVRTNFDKIIGELIVMFAAIPVAELTAPSSSPGTGSGVGPGTNAPGSGSAGSAPGQTPQHVPVQNTDTMGSSNSTIKKSTEQNSILSKLDDFFGISKSHAGGGGTSNIQEIQTYYTNLLSGDPQSVLGSLSTLPGVVDTRGELSAIGKFYQAHENLINQYITRDMCSHVYDTSGVSYAINPKVKQIGKVLGGMSLATAATEMAEAGIRGDQIGKINESIDKLDALDESQNLGDGSERDLLIRKCDLDPDLPECSLLENSGFRDFAGFGGARISVSDGRGFSTNTNEGFGRNNAFREEDITGSADASKVDKPFSNDLNSGISRNSSFESGRVPGAAVKVNTDPGGGGGGGGGAPGAAAPSLGAAPRPAAPRANNKIIPSNLSYKGSARAQFKGAQGNKNSAAQAAANPFDQFFNKNKQSAQDREKILGFQKGGIADNRTSIFERITNRHHESLKNGKLIEYETIKR